LSLGSSEEVADAKYVPQGIDHPISPRNLYGSAKAASRTIVDNYRNKYNLYASHVVCMNFESERKSSEFISKKIAQNVARIYFEIQNQQKIVKLHLGNLDNRRDFSSCLDFCDGFWRILNQELYNKDWDGKPKNYLLASGESHSIREFAELAFQVIGIDEYEKYIESDPNFCRPNESVELIGDSTPARVELGWAPNFSFYYLVDGMVKWEIENYSER
jgi:GDPmannose 4,6-dehydratase